MFRFTPFCFTSLVFLVLVTTLTFSDVSLGAFSSGRGRSKNKPVYGQGQLETAELWNIILPDQPYETYPRYNHQYRPPSEDNQPTIVDISLINFRVTSLNLTTRTMRFQADLVREYTDSRLTYDPPSKAVKFVKVPVYTEVWTPRLRLMDVEFCHEPDTDLAEVAESFVTPQGRVFRKVQISSEITKNFEEFHEEMNETKKENEREKDLEFSIRLVGSQDTSEDLQFRWRTDNPVILETQKFRTSEGIWSVAPDIRKCRRTEKYGSFIEHREFTCLQLVLKLVSLKR